MHDLVLFPPLQKEGGERNFRSRHSGFADSLPLINLGYGEDPTIRERAEAFADAVGFTGAIEWDRGNPHATLCPPCTNCKTMNSHK